MDNYHPVDITSHVKEVITDYPAPAVSAPDFRLPSKPRKFSIGSSTRERKNYRGTGHVTERLKVKTNGRDGFSLGHENVNLRYVEQIVDEEQTSMLAQLTKLVIERFAEREISFDKMIEFLTNQIGKEGFQCVCGKSYINGKLAMPRLQEIYACLNRYPF